MPFLELRYFSNALGVQTACNVILPDPSVPGPYHVMFLLHGLSDDHTIWSRRTSIERYVEGLPLIVVMPNGGRGFYSDAHVGSAFYTGIAVELPQIIEHYFPTKVPWCVTGLSMGGYGAAKLALSLPARFISGASHSGAMMFGSGKDTSRSEEFTRIVGPNPAGGPDDLYTLAKALRPNQRPHLRIDCGVDDFLYGQNGDFHSYLQSIGFEHEYDEFPGDHTWAYWDEHVQEAIAFHCRNLGISRG